MVVAIDAYKIAYMPLPKAACTSVKMALGVLDGAFTAGEVDIKTAHDRLQTRRFRQDRWEVYGKDWFRFCVVRDPFERLMSAYLDLVVTRNALAHSRRIRAMAGKLPTDPDPDFFFQNLARYQRASSLVKHHTFQAHVFIGSDLGAYDAVYATSDLTPLETALGKRCHQRVVLPRANVTKLTLSWGDLVPKTQAAVANWLASDYDLLRGHFTPVPQFDDALHGRHGRAA